jgi:hypothetical protein
MENIKIYTRKIEFNDVYSTSQKAENIICTTLLEWLLPNGQWGLQ